jgi:hypothetical protein
MIQFQQPAFLTPGPAVFFVTLNVFGVEVCIIWQRHILFKRI